MLRRLHNFEDCFDGVEVDAIRGPLPWGKTLPVVSWNEVCLPSLQHDPNRPEDVLKVDADEDGVGGDDTADCLRYQVATKSRVVAQRKLRGL